jgi:uncharacterized protein YbbC (DUF1343 family)/CubicO group peptidase (beta-lactamase class C family)
MRNGKQNLAGVILAVVLLGLLSGCAGVAPLKPVAPPPPPEEPARPAPVEEAPSVPLALDPQRFAQVKQVVSEEIAAGSTPGAVVLVGHQGKIVYLQAFGERSLFPRRQAMTPDTIFDLASLTKVVATTTAVLQLVDAKRLQLDAPVARYWKEFAQNGKARITVRQLLTHTSGLRADVNPRMAWHGYEGAIAAIAADAPIRPPGTMFHYSDANFIALGELVRRVSGLTLDVYCREKIFKPLGMKDTAFLPSPAKQGRIAPCDLQGDRLRWGEVHDPTAYRMGGVAGNAGVFSTAPDLALFCQMLVNGGQLGGKRILSPQAVAAMAKPNGLPGTSTQRGLGWDIKSPYAKAHNHAFPKGSFGHTGYTGTSIWIDPRSQSYLIILTNRLHPNGRGNVKALRAKTAAAVAQALRLGPPAEMSAWEGGEAPVMEGFGAADGRERLQTGLEVLAAQGFAPLKGKNLGVITNHTGIDRNRRPLLQLLLKTPGVKVRTIFSPEHGLSGTLDEKVPSGRDPATGLMVYSLYGTVKKPTPEMLRGLDALVYDIQDVGTRFYTYITTMAYAMEAARAAGLEFYVLDRPNPLTAAAVQGPVLEPGLKSYIGYFPLPVRYGLTVGELATLLNRENGIGVKLTVIPMRGYRRELWFDQTGLPWVNPSPNLRSLTQATLYPGVAMVEAANVSVGRGTATPFEVVGAPWIVGERLARHLNGRHLSGVKFEPVVFVPQSSRYAGQRCEGVRLRLTDRTELDAPALGLELAHALYHLFPGKFDLERTRYMIGSTATLAAIRNGTDPQDIRRAWQPALAAFLRLRQKYLMY